jgi:hypothetical protein
MLRVWAGTPIVGRHSRGFQDRQAAARCCQDASAGVVGYTAPALSILRRGLGIARVYGDRVGTQEPERQDKAMPRLRLRHKQMRPCCRTW